MKKVLSGQLKFMLILAWVGLLSACQIQFAQPTETPLPSATSTITLTPTPSATPTATPIPPDVITAEKCSDPWVWTKIGKGRINQIFYTQDGKSLLIASTSGLELYDVQKGELIWSTEIKAGVNQAGIYEKTQIILALDGEEELHFFDLKTGHHLDSGGKNDQGMSPTITENASEIAIGGWDGYIYTYDIEKDFQVKQKIKSIGASPDAMFADSVFTNIKYSPDGKYIGIATLRAEFFIYRTSDGAKMNHIVPLDPDYDHRIFINSIAFSRNNQFFAVSYRNGQTVYGRVGNTGQGKLVEGSSASLSADGEVIALHKDEGVELLKTANGQSLGLLPGTKSTLGNTVFSPDSQTLAVVLPSKTEFWSVKDMLVTQEVETSYSDYQAIQPSHNGKWLAIGNQSTIELHPMGSEQTRVISLTHPARYIHFSSDDQFLVAAGDMGLTLWDIEKNLPAQVIKVERSIISLDITGNASLAMIVIANENTEPWLLPYGKIEIYDLTTGSKLAFNTPNDDISTALFIENGSKIVALADKIMVSNIEEANFKDFSPYKGYNNIQVSNDQTTIIAENQTTKNTGFALFDIKTQKQVKSISVEHQSFAIHLPDNLLVVSNGKVGELKIYNYPAIKSCTLKSFNALPTSMVFSEDGKTLFILDQAGYVYITKIRVVQ